MALPDRFPALEGTRGNLQPLGNIRETQPLACSPATKGENPTTHTPFQSSPGPLTGEATPPYGFPGLPQGGLESSHVLGFVSFEGREDRCLDFPPFSGGLLARRWGSAVAISSRS